MRKQMMAIAAGLALGAASLATPALAAHGGGHGGGGGGGGHAMGGGGGRGFGGGGGGFRAQGVSPQMSAGPARNNFAAAPNAATQFRGNMAANNRGYSGNWNRGGNWNHGHWHGGYGGGGVYAFGLGPYGYGPDYYDYSDGYSDGCYQQQYVQTAYGPQLQWINVCE